MNRLLKVLAIVLLLLNGVGAVWGGGNLILFPDGSSLQLPLDHLKYTPFRNYFIPGIILLIVNGLFSFVTLIALLLKLRNFSMLVLAQGALLTGWIIAQITLIRTIHSLHLIFGSIGILLIIVGGFIRKDSK